MYGRVKGLVFQLKGSLVWFEGLRDVEFEVQVAGAYQRVSFRGGVCEDVRAVYEMLCHAEGLQSVLYKRHAPATAFHSFAFWRCVG